MHQICQQSCSEAPAGGPPHVPSAQLLLQQAVCVTQAEARQHTHRCVALQPETLDLQDATEVKKKTKKTFVSQIRK